MANSATPAPDAQHPHLQDIAEILAEQFYLTIMQATQDHWLTWEHVPHATKSGYYDLGYEVADQVLLTLGGEEG